MLKWVLHVVSSLIVELNKLREMAKPITGEQIQSDRGDNNLDIHPLSHTFEILNDILIQQSQEAIDREAERNKAKREAKPARTNMSPTKDKAPIGDDVQSASASGPRLPSTLPSTPQKRNFS